jgi:hypothetical protein
MRRVFTYDAASRAVGEPCESRGTLGLRVAADSVEAALAAAREIDRTAEVQRF